MAQTGTIQSFVSPNFSGVLFNKGNIRTPFSTMIGGNRRITQHVEFVTGQEFTSEGGAQPNISETASLNAPPPTFLTREQRTNVTQIFHEAVAISYAKQSNMDTLSGINIAGQDGFPSNELAWQVLQRMRKIGRDIEYTAINGVYSKATVDTEANRTRGMNAAITSNTVAAGGEPLNIWMVNELMQKIYKGNAPIQGLVLWVDPTTLNQLNADAIQNNMTIVPASRTVNGIQIMELLMPLGNVGIRLGEFIPTGTAFLFNFDVIRFVEQPTPGKGNFFLEELARTGAGESHQIFGQIGIDHGPEWWHGKITGISTDFVPPSVP